MARIGEQRFEVRHRLIGMPDEVITAGSIIHCAVTAVDMMDDGAIEIVMEYLDHEA